MSNAAEIPCADDAERFNDIVGSLLPIFRAMYPDATASQLLEMAEENAAEAFFHNNDKPAE